MQTERPPAFTLRDSMRTMKIRLALIVLMSLPLLKTPPVIAASGDLTAYFVDVEGGQATLFIAPSGQTVLIDTGFPGNNGRDANRIAAAAKEAGVKQIDYLIITHYHGDHVGGVPALASRLPVRNFVDHGEIVEKTEAAQKLYSDYLKETAKGHRMIVKPGDKLPVSGLEWTIVTAAGKVLEKPLPGAGKPNPFCANVKPKETDPTENAQSTGSYVVFGKFRMADLGDLTWNKEMDLMCPNAKIGEVDLYVVNHHGMAISNSPSLVDALHPKVAIMDNGEKKGGIPEAWDVVHSSPGLVDLWQSHFIAAGGKDHNTDDKLIANVSGDSDPGNYLKLVAHKDGHFEVTNPRTAFTKKY
jgi:competence protein ComEC